jgi:hypothetical protein
MSSACGEWNRSGRHVKNCIEELIELKLSHSDCRH